MSLALHYWMRGAHHCSGPSVSEMSHSVSNGTLNSTIPYHTYRFCWSWSLRQAVSTLTFCASFAGYILEMQYLRDCVPTYEFQVCGHWTAMTSIQLIQTLSWGYWRQRVMRGLATLPKVHPGAFSGQRQRWKTPPVCVAVVHCLEIMR